MRCRRVPLSVDGCGRGMCGQDPFRHLYRDHDVEGMSDGCEAHPCFQRCALPPSILPASHAHFRYRCVLRFTPVSPIGLSVAIQPPYAVLCIQV